MADNFFSDIKIAEFKECFDMFDRDKDGYISLKELGFVLRAIGHEFTEIELSEYINDLKNLKLDKNHEIRLNFQNFVELMTNRLRDVDMEEELYEAFRLFDKEERGMIPSNEFKHIMTSLGDKLSEEEVDEMIRDADPHNDGQINYREFIRVMLSK